jgi:hypothetical protein
MPVSKQENEKKAKEEHLIAQDKMFTSFMREIDKCFEALQKEMNTHFEVIGKRFTFMQWFTGFGFGFLAFLITLINFLVK